MQSKSPTQNQQPPAWGLLIDSDCNPYQWDKVGSYRAWNSHETYGRGDYDPAGMDEYVKEHSKWQRPKNKPLLLLKVICKEDQYLISPLARNENSRFGHVRVREAFEADINHYRSGAQSLLKNYLEESKTKHQNKLRVEFMKTRPRAKKMSDRCHAPKYEMTNRLIDFMWDTYRKRVNLFAWSSLNVKVYDAAYHADDGETMDACNHYWQVCLLQKAIKWELG